MDFHHCEIFHNYSQKVWWCQTVWRPHLGRYVKVHFLLTVFPLLSLPAGRQGEELICQIVAVNE